MTRLLSFIPFSLVPIAIPFLITVIPDTKRPFSQNIVLDNPKNYPLRASDGGVKITFRVASKPRILIIANPLRGPNAQRIRYGE